MQSVFNFLDVPNHQVTGKTRKNTNDDLRQVIENFSDLCEYYRGTRYADMFVELQSDSDASMTEGLSGETPNSAE